MVHSIPDLRRSPIAAIAALLAITAAIAAGCGGGEEEEEIRGVVDRYQQAYSEGDGAALCATLTPSSVEDLGGEDECARGVTRDLDSIGAQRRQADGLTIASIEVEGDFGVVSFDQSLPDAVVIREDGRWYMAPLTE